MTEEQIDKIMEKARRLKLQADKELAEHDKKSAKRTKNVRQTLDNH